MKSTTILLLCSMVAMLAACGSPKSLSQRPKSDDVSCQRVDGSTRCSDFIPASRDPAQYRPF
jgi:uncharacterized lipoprotein